MVAALQRVNESKPEEMGASRNMGDIVEEDLSKTQIQPPG